MISLPEIHSFESETMEENEELDRESSLDSPILKTRSFPRYMKDEMLHSQNKITIKKHQDIMFLLNL